MIRFPSDQPVLPFLPAVVGLPCAYGQTGAAWPGPHHCADCAAAVAEACRTFADAVAAGTYDQDGYTPDERRAQTRRAA